MHDKARQRIRGRPGATACCPRRGGKPAVREHPVLHRVGRAAGSYARAAHKALWRL